MKTKIHKIILVFACLLTTAANAQKNDIERSQLKGKVKYVRDSVVNHAITMGSYFFMDESRPLYMEFNPQGNLIKFKGEPDIDYSKYAVTKTYDHKNMLMSTRTLYSYSLTKDDLDNDFERQEYFEYDPQGRMIKERWELSNEKYSGSGATVYKYDKKGNLTAKSYFESGSDDSLKWTIKYKYDDKKRIKEMIRFDNFTGMGADDSIVLLYNENGNLMDSIVYVPVTKEILARRKITYEGKNKTIEYFEKNRLDKKHLTIDNGSTITYDYFEYDLNGNPDRHLRKTYDKTTGNLITYKATDYDNGNVKEYEYTFSYEYDTNKNWIKRTAYEKGKKLNERFRTITYY